MGSIRKLMDGKAALNGVDSKRKAKERRHTINVQEVHSRDVALHKEELQVAGASGAYLNG
jgi:hypothetical protein